MVLSQPVGASGHAAVLVPARTARAPWDPMAYRLALVRRGLSSSLIRAKLGKGAPSSRTISRWCYAEGAVGPPVAWRGEIERIVGLGG